MPRFASALALAFVLVGLAAPAQVVSRLPGVVVIQSSQGDLLSRRATLQIPPEWKGELIFTLGGVQMHSAAFSFQPPSGGNTSLAILFSNVPSKTGATAVGLKGIYTSRGYSGTVYQPTLEAIKNNLAPSVLLADLAGEAKLFTSAGNFIFSPGRVNLRQTQPASNDPNNPCPNGPCWSTGGTGRYAEQYAGGTIQNPGRPSQAATFNRGVPDAWTIEGQRQAQQIGIDRSNALYNQINGYSAPWYWGFFWW